MVNCKRCNAVFVMTDSPYCNTCLVIEEEFFKSVKEYLYSNPRSNANQVSDSTGVPVAKILDYIREGRIQLKNQKT